MLGGHRARFQWLARLVAAPFVVLRVPATAITFLALVPAAVAAWLVSQQQWFAAVAWGLVAGLFDMADGAVARQTGQVTPFGGFLDSVLDRVVDVVFLFAVGFAVASPAGWLLVGLGVIGSYGTSYTRARAYEAKAIPRDAWAQLFERPERLTVLALGALAQGFIEFARPDLARPGGHTIMFWALAVFVVGSLVTYAQRILLVRRLLREA